MTRKRNNKKTSNQKPSQVSEPSVAYASAGKISAGSSNFKSITFFNSFEEMEESKYKYWNSLTSAERLALLYDLQQHFFADELKRHPTMGTRLFFKEP